jgi:RNA polymerase sigma factor (sigma-70 family)
VVQNGGAEEDAEDIFQDGIIIIYNKINLNQFILTSSFKTYLYSVCRNLWLQKLSKRKAIFDKLTDIEGYIDLPQEMFNETKLEEAEKHKIIQVHFLSLSDDCQKLLRLFAKNIPLREIALILGFKTEKYAKTRKYLCKEELKKRIANDPRNHKFFRHDN